MKEKKPCAWFRFGLRTLFVLLTVFGVWLGVQVKWIRDRQALLTDSRVASADISTDFSGLLGGGESGRPVAPGCLPLLGERGVTSITLWMTADNEADRKRLNEFQRLFPESRIELTPLPTPR